MASVKHDSYRETVKSNFGTGRPLDWFPQINRTNCERTVLYPYLARPRTAPWQWRALVMSAVVWPGWVWKGNMAKTVLVKNRIVGAIGGESPSDGGNGIIEISQPYNVEVTIVGVAPIMFHRWNVESNEAKGRSKKGSIERKTDDVETFVYRNPKGELCIPGEYLRGAIVNAAKFQQDPRSPRKSAADLFKAAIISLTPLASMGVKTWDYLDKRRVLIQRNAVTRSRPAMSEGWKATFILMVNLPEYISQKMLHEVLSNAGRLVGLGDFRPSFGRFQINSFKVLED
jgi:hypothetical protein